jgi:phosphatidylinositol dimannoside acyltransferase
MPFIKDFILSIYWGPFKKLIQKAPCSLIYPVGTLLSPVVAQCLPGRKKALEEELQFIFGSSVDEERRKSIIQKAIRIEIWRELEVLLYPVLNSMNISCFAACEGLEHIGTALSSGKGALLLFAHFGANQMIMPALGYSGYRMSQLSAPAKVWKDILPGRELSAMEQYALQVRTAHEQSLPVRHINIFGSIKEAFLCLRRNEILGVAIDGGGGKERIAVDFLGRQALLSPGPADIARRTGCGVLPTFVLREGSGRNRVIIESPLKLIRGEDAKKTVAEVAQAFASRLQEYVLAYPEYYVGFMALRTFMSRKGDVPLLADSN